MSGDYMDYCNECGINSDTFKRQESQLATMREALEGINIDASYRLSCPKCRQSFDTSGDAIKKCFPGEGE